MKQTKTLVVVVSLCITAVITTSFVASKGNNELKVSEESTVTELKRDAHSKSVFDVADSICKEAGVPFELIKEIGQNESGWRYITNTNGGSDHGDLQVIDETYWYWYDRLELKGGKTRRNYLKVGIYYIQNLHHKYGSWKKARFAYGRGHWRDASTWTCLEEKFMGKIDWTKYDK